MKFFRENAPVLLFAFNLLIGAALLAQLAFSGGGYRSASPVLELEQSAVREVEIRDPRQNLQVRLVRGQELPRVAPAREEEFDPRKAMDRMESQLNRNAEYNWELVVVAAPIKIARKGEKEVKGEKDAPAERRYGADGERVKALFTALGDARRYYAVPRSPEKDRDLEMGKNDRGEYETPRVIFRLASGGEQVLYLGRTRAGSSEAYVRLGEEDQIFLVETDLRQAAGAADAYFFRDRSVWGRKLSLDGVTGLVARFREKKNNVTLMHSAEGWTMSAPLAGKVRPTEISSLLNDIVDWKADAFPLELPEEIEKDSAFDLEISYKEEMTGVPAPLRLTVLGKKDYSTYYIRRVAEKGEEPQPIMQVTSVYLGDFYEPERKLIDRPGAAGAGAGLGLPAGGGAEEEGQ